MMGSVLAVMQHLGEFPSFDSAGISTGGPNHASDGNERFVMLVRKSRDIASRWVGLCEITGFKHFFAGALCALILSSWPFSEL